MSLEASVYSGIDYRNFKWNVTIEMLALVDAENNYTFLDVQYNGRISYVGFFKET